MEQHQFDLDANRILGLRHTGLLMVNGISTLVAFLSTLFWLVLGHLLTWQQVPTLVFAALIFSGAWISTRMTLTGIAFEAFSSAMKGNFIHKRIDKKGRISGVAVISNCPRFRLVSLFIYIQVMPTILAQIYRSENLRFPAPPLLHFPALLISGSAIALLVLTNEMLKIFSSL